MPNLKFAILLGSVGTLMASCTSTGIMSRDRPDEFAVQRQAPLVVPPDFSLTPPAPGVPRPSEGTAAEQALEALFGGPQARSEIERTTLDRAGRAEPGIRSKVGDPDTNTVAKGRITRDIIAAPEGDGASASTIIPG